MKLQKPKQHVSLATSIALKCSISKELLDDLERKIDQLDLEADTTLSQRPGKSFGVPQSCNENDTNILKGKVSIRVPDVIKSAKKKREDVLEKKKRKKKKTTKKTGTATN